MKTAIERFMQKVVVDATTGCHLWTGATLPNGYGYMSFRLNGKPKNCYPHRWIWEYAIGPIPVGLQVHHICYRRNCVNVAHLAAVTPRENSMDARVDSPPARLSRRTHCARGHLLGGENVRTVNGKAEYRNCLACWRLALKNRKRTDKDRERDRARWQKRKERKPQ